jgi:hypothetical protein
MSLMSAAVSEWRDGGRGFEDHRPSGDLPLGQAFRLLRAIPAHACRSTPCSDEKWWLGACIDRLNSRLDSHRGLRLASAFARLSFRGRFRAGARALQSLPIQRRLEKDIQRLKL